MSRVTGTSTIEVTTEVTIRVGGAAVVVVVVVVDVVFGGDVTAGVDVSATAFGFSSTFSSEGTTKPTITKKAKTAATIHGHFRFFFVAAQMGNHRLADPSCRAWRTAAS